MLYGVTWAISRVAFFLVRISGGRRAGSTDTERAIRIRTCA